MRRTAHSRDTMSALPHGWDFDYDGTRWFYTYKATGHIQYHFPSEGDEFPDFIDAASPAPALAPEERLESQRQQVRRHASLNQNQHLPVPSQRHGHYAAGARGAKNGMSATATPVSYVWEDERQEPQAPFQPESFMYLGPGSYADVSPLMEEEEEAARRVVAGSSPGSSLVTPADGRSRTGGSPMQGQWALPAHSPQFSSHPGEEGNLQQGAEIDGHEVVHMLDGQEVVHMLDGREMPMELEGVTRFDPVGVVAEMGSRETQTARVEEEPVEMPAEETLAPIERTMAVSEGLRTGKAEEDVQEALRNLEQESSSRENGVVPVHDEEGMASNPLSDSTQPTQLRTAPSLEGVEDTAPKHPSDPTHAQPEVAPPASTFKIARKPTNAKYQAFTPGQAANQQMTEPAERSSDSLPIRREPSLKIGAGHQIYQPVDPESIPSSLALRQEQSQEAPRRQPTPGEEWKHGDDSQGLASHPSVLNPARRGETDSNESSRIVSAPNYENSVDPGIDPGQEPSGVTKFPSVLKPARGRAPSIPPKQTYTWPTESLPKKSYEQEDPGRPLDEEDKKYVPYTGPRLMEQSLPVPDIAQRPLSDVQPTIEAPPDFPQPPPVEAVRPVSVLPVVETTPAAERQSLQEERHLPYRLVRANSSEVHQPTSISAAPDGGPRPIAPFAAMPSLAFVNGGVPSPSSSDQTSLSSPKEGVAAAPKVVSPDEVSPLRSREASLSSGTAHQTPSPMEARRRGSSVVSSAQTQDGMSTWTPSPQSETPPSAAQAGPPQRRPSGLRHHIPNIETDVPDVNSGPSSSKTPLESGPLGTGEEATSYFPAPDSLRRMSLPYSILEDSDASSPAVPTPPPKSPERQAPQHSRSIQETRPPEFEQTSVDPSPAQTPPPLEAPPSQTQMGGHVLHSIEEGEEEPHEEIFVAKRVVMKRHSASSGSIQLSPTRIKGKPVEGLGQRSPGAGQGMGSSHQRTVSQPVPSPTVNAPSPQPQDRPVQQAPAPLHQRTVSQPVHPQTRQAERPAPQASPQQPLPPANAQQGPQPPIPGPAVSHQRTVSQPIQPPARQVPMPQGPPQPYENGPQPPFGPHQVPQWQVPQGHVAQNGPASLHMPPSQPWHVPMPPQGFQLGTTTQVSSPGQREKERGWKKLFKKTPAKDTPAISAPIQTPQQHPQQYYIPAGQMPPDTQYPPQWAPGGAPVWQPPSAHHPPTGNVQLPPAVGDRPGVSRIPGFEVTEGPQRMPTVRRGSALGSNPFDAGMMPPPLFDKETAP